MLTRTKLLVFTSGVAFLGPALAIAQTPPATVPAGRGIDFSVFTCEQVNVNDPAWLGAARHGRDPRVAASWEQWQSADIRTYMALFDRCNPPGGVQRSQVFTRMQLALTVAETRERTTSQNAAADRQRLLMEQERQALQAEQARQQAQTAAADRMRQLADEDQRTRAGLALQQQRREDERRLSLERDRLQLERDRQTHVAALEQQARDAEATAEHQRIAAERQEMEAVRRAQAVQAATERQRIQAEKAATEQAQQRQAMQAIQAQIPAITAKCQDPTILSGVKQAIENITDPQVGAYRVYKLYDAVAYAATPQGSAHAMFAGSIASSLAASGVSVPAELDVPMCQVKVMSNHAEQAFGYSWKTIDGETFITGTFVGR